MKRKDYTLLALFIPFAIAVLSCLPGCYREEIKPVQELEIQAKQPIKTPYTCPDCGEWGCIYEDIDTRIEGDGTDQEIETAIYQVCKDRGITDSTTIELLKREYYL